MNDCNYCLHKRMASDATRNGLVILQVPSKQRLGGLDLYLVEAGHAPRKKDWVGWIMALPAHCEC